MLFYCLTWRTRRKKINRHDCLFTSNWLQGLTPRMYLWVQSLLLPFQFLGIQFLNAGYCFSPNVMADNYGNNICVSKVKIFWACQVEKDWIWGRARQGLTEKNWKGSGGVGNLGWTGQNLSSLGFPNESKEGWKGCIISLQTCQLNLNVHTIVSSIQQFDCECASESIPCSLNYLLSTFAFNLQQN